MIELFFAAGIPFAVFLIFENIPSLEEYSYIVYWLFIACLIAFGITVLIKAKAVFTIVNAVATGKSNAHKKR